MQINVVNAAMSIIDRHQKYSEKPLSERVTHLLATAMQVIKVGIFKSEAQREAAVMMAEPK
jgi:hypothetical protein